MKNSLKSPEKNDHNQNIKELVRKGAELKDRSRQLIALLDATREQCNQLLHPEQTQNDSTVKKK